MFLQHRSLCIFCIIYNNLYRSVPSGTLVNLCHLVAVELVDFATEGYILSMAMDILNISKFEDDVAGDPQLLLDMVANEIVEEIHTSPPSGIL